MPFDGSELSRLPAPLPTAPLPLGATPAPWTRRAWTRLRALLPGERGCSPPDAALVLLRAARALIEAEADWTVGAYRTRDGRHCAVGALRAAAWGLRNRRGFKAYKKAHGLLLAVASEHGFSSVERMNDRTTHAQVLAAFDAAIAEIASRQPVACRPCRTG